MKKLLLIILTIFTCFSVYSQCPNPEIVWFQVQNQQIIIDGFNYPSVNSYEIAYKAGATFIPGDGTETIYSFNEFPTQLTGLTPGTVYYMTVRSICVDGTENPWQDNNMDGPDPWQTSTCPDVYNLPFNFTFDGNYVPCHKFVDADDDLYYWYWFDYGFNNGEGVVGSSYSWTQDDGPLTPDNWMILGPINLSAVDQASLTWKVRGLNPGFCQENYSVYVSESNNISDILENSLSYNETIESGGDACGNTFTDRALDISEMTGGQVYVSFRHHDVTDMFHLNVDDILVQEGLGSENQVVNELTHTFNTTTQLFTLQSNAYQLQKLQIFDTNGRAIAEKNVDASYTSFNFQQHSTGLYFVVVTTPNGPETIKVLNP